MTNESQQFLVVLRPSRATFPGDATEHERAIVGEHFRALTEAATPEPAGGVRVLLAGRTQTDASPMGLVVLEAPDEAAARSFVEADPAVAAGIFLAELHPYAVAIESFSAD